MEVGTMEDGRRVRRDAWQRQRRSVDGAPTPCMEHVWLDAALTRCTQTSGRQAPDRAR
jgi:hypothetical protein